jgi:hypothetical protein
MSIGPGKYDELCTLVREEAQAKGAIVVIINGYKGSGFSVQADAFTTAHLAVILEDMAAEIRRSISTLTT